jgi:DNA-binding transcriptional LysR family regulator
VLLHRPPGGRRPVELTEAGHAFLAHANALLARTLAARADLDAVERGERGRVAVATIQSIGARILPGTLARYRAAQPRVEVDVREATSVAWLLDAVETGTVDVGFTCLPVPDGPFAVRELLSDPYVLVVAADAGERVLGDLHGRRLLGVRGCKAELLIEQLLIGRGIVPSASERFDDNAMIQGLVAAGEGMAVVPRLTVDLADRRVTAHLVPEVPPRQVVAVTHRERLLGPAAGQLIEGVRDARQPLDHRRSIDRGAALRSAPRTPQAPLRPRSCRPRFMALRSNTDSLIDMAARVCAEHDELIAIAPPST